MDPKVMKWKLLNYSLVSLLHLVPQTEFVGLALSSLYKAIILGVRPKSQFFQFLSIHVQTRTFQNQKKILF